MDVIIRLGDKGPHVIQIQKGLDKGGYWPKGIPFSENFGPTTDKVVREFQKKNLLVIDGKVGEKTLKLLGVHIPKSNTPITEKYKDVIIKGSVFPDAPIVDYTITLNSEMVREYLPTIESLNFDRGLKLLCTIMAYKEGFRKGTRSYRTNNPGNIGNTDSGSNVSIATLKDGILRQKAYIERIIAGKNTAYPMGKLKKIPPFYSKEIAKNQKAYGMSPYLPGYEFVFTGQLDQFVKIYATGARAGNSYLSMIRSYLKAHGIVVTGQTKIQDIIKIQ